MKNNRILTHNGMTLSRVTLPNGRPTMMKQLLVYVKACDDAQVPATKAGFLAFAGKHNPTGRGQYTTFFGGVKRTGAFKISRGPKGENVYTLNTK